MDPIFIGMNAGKRGSPERVWPYLCLGLQGGNSAQASCYVLDCSKEAYYCVVFALPGFLGCPFLVVVVVSLSLFSRETPVLFRYYFCYLPLSLSSFFWS